MLGETAHCCAFCAVLKEVPDFLRALSLSPQQRPWHRSPSDRCTGGLPNGEPLTGACMVGDVGFNLADSGALDR